MVRRSVAAIVTGATLVRLALSPLRILSPDEAYYLASARLSMRVPDHPPLLGWLLAVGDRLPGPVELRVRAVAALLSIVTTLGIVALAGALADARGVERRPALAAAFASFGLIGFAGGLLATPDAPLLAAIAWMFAVTTRRPRPVVLFALAAIALSAKASALLPIAAIVIALRRHRLAAIATCAGAIVALPLALPSLRLQVAHVVGAGPLVSAPHVGPLAAVAALWVGAFLLYSPPVLVRAWKDRGALAHVPGARLTMVGFVIALTASALASGRPPEPNWIAPAMIVATAAACLRAARSTVLVLHVAPTIVAIALWVGPDTTHIEPLARTPHRLGTPPASPSYAGPALRCIYVSRCDDMHAISVR